MSPTHYDAPTTPREPSITAASMLDTLATVLGGAVSRYRWGMPAQGAINAAVREYPVPLLTELACRATWYAMLEAGEAVGSPVNDTSPTEPERFDEQGGGA